MSAENTPAAAPAASAPAAPASSGAPGVPGRSGPGGDRRGPGGPGGPGGRRNGPGGPGRSPRRDNRNDAPASEFNDKVVHINRCSKVVKGGRRFNFAALIVAGDGKGRVGVGYGKAKEVPDAIRKGTDRAHRALVRVNLRGNTIPHEVIGHADGGVVMLRPAAPGTGLIAGGGVRAVLEVAGYKDVLSKSMGSNNPQAVVKATLDGLSKLRTLEQIKALRA
ncbi:MAG: 30S ribosomal protein S5 [Opitutia bacterium AMD-G1]|nr:MAG: 30S ribosomal protein S5 [Opitutae bacterium AMD-G1]